MMASPYDLSDLGYEPIPIETADGKAEYVRRQRAFAERGNELRRRLLTAWLGAGQGAGVQSAQGAQTAPDAARSSRSVMVRSAAS